jgi:hypothetical protein
MADAIFGKCVLAGYGLADGEKRNMDNVQLRGGSVSFLGVNWSWLPGLSASSPQRGCL